MYIYFGDRVLLMELLHLFNGAIFQDNEDQIEEICQMSPSRNIFIIKSIKNKHLLNFANDNNIFLIENNPKVPESTEITKNILNRLFAKHFDVPLQNFKQDFYQNYLQYKVLGFVHTPKKHYTSPETIGFLRKQLFLLKNPTEKNHFLKQLIFKLENSFLKTGLTGMTTYYEVISHMLS